LSTFSLLGPGSQGVAHLRAYPLLLQETAWDCVYMQNEVRYHLLGCFQISWAAVL